MYFSSITDINWNTRRLSYRNAFYLGDSLLFYDWEVFDDLSELIGYDQ